MATIRIGIGGWTYEPWRDTFYPRGLPHARELEWASRQLRVIEINGTYYRAASPANYAAWRDATPDGFVFSVKAPRFATQRRVLAEAGDSVRRFIDGGLAELGDRLGPLLWQFAPTKRFDAVDMQAFVDLLPDTLDGRRLRHVLDVRHDSFRCAEFVALARRRGVAVCFTESDEFPPIADLMADFVYARIMRTESRLREGCAPAVLDALAACTHAWRQGGEPSGVPRVDASPAPEQPRDVFLFFIAGAKERAPAAAMALQRRVDAAGG